VFWAVLSSQLRGRPRARRGLEGVLSWEAIKTYYTIRKTNSPYEKYKYLTILYLLLIDQNEKLFQKNWSKFESEVPMA
jgi:hypothetical protein